MEKKAISVPGSKLYGPYTPGVKSGGVIWLSGQIDVEAGDDTASQTAGALAKIDALLAAAGVTKDAVCFAQVLLDDIGDFQAMNEVYGAWVESMDVKPARAAFEAGPTSRSQSRDCCSSDRYKLLLSGYYAGNAISRKRP